MSSNPSEAGVSALKSRAHLNQRDIDNDGIGNACDADIAPAANDCIVNAQDLGALRSAFFASPGDANWNPDADFNGDDTVNVIDLALLRRDFFKVPGFAANPVNCVPPQGS